MAFDRLISLSAALRAFSARNRIALTVIAVLLFGGGMVWAVGQLDVTLASLEWRPLLVVVLVFVPLDIALSALNLSLLAKIVDTRISAKDSLVATVIGRVAEVLPIPGAALVRGAALLRSGASFKAMIGVLAVSSLMTLALAGVFAAIPLLPREPWLAYVLLAGSVLVFIGSMGWVARKAGAAIVSAMLALRLGILALTTLRFVACFLVIGSIVPVRDALLFVVGGTVTTYVGILPAGLGVSEGISAALALLIGVLPAAAFLAAAINRLCGLGVGGVIALAMIATGAYQPRPAT
ncbi:hypothetical protein [Aurantiacibacter sp. MUD61]|uniref:hypothetical protein n=1 Tax=Aurantiacibacter sp. MUD61 TaxID=3009083 RepID=UPI0022F0EDCF|nr:hypothetical protein [Aurantiacibacter sp. MUD61]